MVIQGVGEDGTHFDVPNVQSELEGMFPWNITIFEGIAWVLCISSALATLFFSIPVYYYVIFYAVFRFSYDFGLGFILDRQSKYKSFTRVYLYLHKKFVV